MSEPTIDMIEWRDGSHEFLFTDGSRLPIPPFGAAYVDRITWRAIARDCTMWELRWFCPDGRVKQLFVYPGNTRTQVEQMLATIEGHVMYLVCNTEDLDEPTVVEAAT